MPDPLPKLPQFTDQQAEDMIGVKVPASAGTLPVMNITTLNVYNLKNLNVEQDDNEQFPEIINPGNERYDYELLDYLESTPKRITITEAFNTTAVARFQNPTEFEDSVAVDYAKFSPHGSSFETMHYIATKNYTVEFDLYGGFTQVRAESLSEAKNDSEENRQKALWWSRYQQHQRNMLLAWAYPRRGFNAAPGHSWSQAPPLLSMEWPNVIDMRCRLTSIKFRNIKFGRNGGVLRWIASCKFEMYPERFLESGDIWGAEAAEDKTRIAEFPGVYYKPGLR